MVDRRGRRRGNRCRDRGDHFAGNSRRNDVFDRLINGRRGLGHRLDLAGQNDQQLDQDGDDHRNGDGNAVNL